MIHQNHQWHLLYSLFVASLAIILLAIPVCIVRSQPAIKSRPSPFQFELPFNKRLFNPRRNNSKMTFEPTSAGSLDPTFGNGGKRMFDFYSTVAASEVALQADGKIVAVGYTGLPDPDFAVYRYNPEGSLDTSFGEGGRVTTDFAEGGDFAVAAAIQPDGKIVAAGWANYGAAALVRYDLDGSLDTSFGTGGKVVTQGHQGIYDLAIQPDGRIIAAGFDFKIARYKTDGSLDTAFGTSGIAWADFNGAPDFATSVAVQPDGKIVAAGGSSNCSDFDPICWTNFVLARFNSDGSLDPSFDGDGKVITPFGGYDDYEWAESIAVQTDGRIIAAGSAGFCGVESCSFDLAATHYNIDGSLDTSFGGDGRVTIDLGSNSESASAVAIQSDGKFVVSGWTAAGIHQSDFALVRLEPDGSVDASFDGDGKLTTDFGGDEAVWDVGIQADDKLIAAGSVGYPASDLALARYNLDGSLDNAFDNDGKVTASGPDLTSMATAVAPHPLYHGETCLVGYINNGIKDDFVLTTTSGRLTITEVGNLNDRANAAARMPDGRIIAAGYSENASNRDFALVRYQSWLTIDGSFNDDGKVTTDFGAHEEVTAVALQGDSKIIAAGTTDVSGTAYLLLARYNSDGSLDESFGTGGSVIVQSIQNPKAIVTQLDGKIIVGGSSPHTEPPFGENFALARFLPDGSLDPSFDSDGMAITRFDHTSRIRSVDLGPYGKIIAAGFTRDSNGTVSDFALASYHPNGSLDLSFDADGKVTTSFTQPSEANAVRVQRNGRIVAAGLILNDSTGRDFALARYSAHGSLDTSFDLDGKQTTDFFGGHDDAFAAAIELDGNIIAAGSAPHGSDLDFAAARYIGDLTGSSARFDYDGDGRTDHSVFRPSTGTWYLNGSSTGFQAAQFGVADDKLTPADYDGDGKTDISVFRPATGYWYTLNSLDLTVSVRSFGASEDLPTPADYDGDGRADVSVFRPSVGTWFRQNSSDGSYSGFQFGQNGDVPTIGDFDADGHSDIAIFRLGTNEWYHILSGDGSLFGLQFGQAGDKIAPADYSGDGRTDIAIYRPSTGLWVVRDSSTAAVSYFYFGLPPDIAVPGDYDGDGKADISVWRPTDGNWYLRQSSNGEFAAFQWGVTGDRPSPAAFGN